MNNKKKTSDATPVTTENITTVKDYAADIVGAKVPTLASYKEGNIAGVITEADATQANSFLALANIDPATKAAIQVVVAAARADVR